VTDELLLNLMELDQFKELADTLSKEEKTRDSMISPQEEDINV
jgi:chromatin segregation and condensation protein Rec8/ScpA/Scc1 (kleisin family)